MTRIAFVIPWFAPNIPGGAEALCRTTARKLFEAGARVEILTTCARELASDWNVNHHPEGTEDWDGIPIRRFKVRKRDTAAFDRVNRKLMSGLSIDAEDEKTFLDEMIHSQGLVDYVKQHREDYVYLPLPYMFGTTFDVTLACPDRSVLVPCLHDESYAYLGPFRLMCESAKGLIFNSTHERELAQDLYTLSPESGVVAGVGVDTTASGNGQRFKEKHGLREYLLYAGRKDEGKNVGLLVEYFCQYKRARGGDLKLVLIGNGTVPIPEEHRGRDVLELGFVPIQDKHDAYAGALALCQPSKFESFSIVMMEAWLAGAPALVHEDCVVTREHCMASRGGLYFADYRDFEGTLEFLRQNPELRNRMAANGAEYVRKNFSWDCVVGKYLGALRGWGFGV